MWVDSDLFEVSRCMSLPTDPDELMLDDDLWLTVANDGDFFKLLRKGELFAELLWLVLLLFHDDPDLDEFDLPSFLLCCFFSLLALASSILLISASRWISSIVFGPASLLADDHLAFLKSCKSININMILDDNLTLSKIF